MTTRLRRWFSFPGLARTVYSSARLATRLMRDPQVPTPMKALPIAAAAYVLSPLDFIPDVIPGLGQVDDLALILMAVEAMRRFAPGHIVAHHEAAIAGGRPYSPVTPPRDDYIDAEFKRG